MIKEGMKKIITARYFRFLIAGLLACGMFFWMGQTALADTYVTVTGSTVNVRSQPEINDSNRIDTVPMGTVVRITGQYGDFFRAYFPEIGYAYIASEWVRFYHTVGTVTAPSAWIFDLPDTYYGTAIGLAQGEESFTVVSYYGNWYGVMYEGELALSKGITWMYPVI